MVKRGQKGVRMPILRKWPIISNFDFQEKIAGVPYTKLIWIRNATRPDGALTSDVSNDRILFCVCLKTGCEEKFISIDWL